MQVNVRTVYQGAHQAEHRHPQSITSVMAVCKQSVLQPVHVFISTSKCGVTCTAQKCQDHGLGVLTTWFPAAMPQQHRRFLERERPPSLFL